MFLKRFFKILRYTIASILLLLLTIVVLVNLTPVQNYLARKGAEMLSKKLKTKVEIAHIRIDFLNHFLIQGLYIEDQAKDTLLYAGEVQVRITDWFIFEHKPVLHFIALQNTYAHLYRTPLSKEWNYQFVADAFSTGKKDTSKGKTIEFDLKKAELENVRIHMDDHWVGEDLDFDIGNLAVNAKDIDFKKEILDVSTVVIKNSGVSVREYKGGRPPGTRHGPLWEDLAHKTPFNPGNWVVQVSSISLDGCRVSLTSNDRVPAPDVFDENHLAIKNIMVSANAISIKGDTIHGNINSLSAQERCGLAVKTMRSKITVSPNASVCEDLYLETNYSKVQNYYAMHYKHFPDFNYYIDSVTMVAHLKDGVVDERDITYFAPQLKKFPGIILKVSGDGKGTVADLSAQHLSVSDGSSTIKGNVTMKGLPDIYKTWITFTDGNLLTSGSGILHYVPGLRNSPDVALEHIMYAYFKGKYEGYIEKFSINGVVTTNLGAVATNIKMNIPGFNGNTVVYSGSVTADNVQIGDFLKQPLLGNITLKEDFSGKSFNPDDLQLNVDGQINEIGIKGYDYHNITNHGVLTKKQFNGTLLVDDPNLALEFDGWINYNNKNVDIQAKAHLLGSNFKALNLTKDTVTLTADFDLNCTGSNIDNFSGYAKLNNIDLKRNMHKLALDSILVSSYGDSTNRRFSVKSNDVAATITGSYQLSRLPASIQYYLSRYIPNFIKAPDKYTPDQNFEFRIATTNIDSIFAVTLPMIRGFDSSVFSGSLNTTAKKLTLNVTVPHGSIGKFHMSNISLNGQGDFDMIGLTTTIDTVVIGDSVLSGSLSLTTTVAHDSVAFTVATTSPDLSSSLSLNGQIIARKDSLFLTLLPSQFYLNQAKWDIAGGSRIIYSDKYLLVQGFSITSGLQKITAATELNNNGKSIIINTENLDLGQLGTWAGLAGYQPDGRINGSIKIDKLFDQLYVDANIKATDVKLGAVNVGTINLIGNYDGAEKLLSLDPQTGIFSNNGSVVASGIISLDTTTHQKLDGSIEFRNAPVAWATPFLTGIMSNLSGTVNGSIGIKGSSYEPIMDGTVNLTKAALHLDYMGCNYTIPYANIHVSNRSIEFGKVMIFDRNSRFAILTGYFSHNLFKNIYTHLNVTSDNFEVMNLTSNDNNLFYGNAIASMDSLTLRGPFDNLSLNVYNATPAAKSTIYIPVTSGSESGTYSFVSFKNYGKKAQDKIISKHKDKFSISIDAYLNNDAEMVIVLDPVSGDEIRAKGEGRIIMDIPPNNDMSINGVYNIDYGTYTYIFNQFFIKRIFILDQGSSITFNDRFAQTSLDVYATYRVKAKLSDLLSDPEKPNFQNELTDDQTPQWVDVALHMNGLLNSPKLTFDLDLEDKHSQNSVAYRRLRLLNGDARQQFAQVGSLLLVGQFVPPEGIGSGTAISGAVNNLSQVLSSSASTGLTNIINKLTRDKDLNVAVKYTNYNYDQTLGGANRSVVTASVNKSLFNDKLIVEVGSTSDWGRPTSTSSSSTFNFTGDFRVQYKINKTGALRLNAFRTSDYDVMQDRDIVRSGVGANWRKSFDNFNDFFRGHKYAMKEKEIQLRKMNEASSDTAATHPAGNQ